MAQVIGTNPGSLSAGSWFVGSGSSYPNMVAGPAVRLTQDALVSSVTFTATNGTGEKWFGFVWNADTGAPLFVGNGVYVTNGTYTDSGPAVLIGNGTNVRVGWWKATTGNMGTAYASGTTGVAYKDAPNKTISGTLYAPGGNSNWGTPRAYANWSSPSRPSTETDVATGVATTSATMNGKCASNYAATNVRFRYSTSGHTDIYGNLDTSLQYTSYQGLAATPNQWTAFSQFVSGLSTNTLYYYQLEATNAYGTNVGGGGVNVASFSTNSSVCSAPSNLSPASGTQVTESGSGNPVTFSWQYNPNGGQPQTGWALQLNDGGSSYWWNTSTVAWVGSFHWNTGTATSVTVPATALTAFAGTSATWQVTTEDSQGPGPISSPASLLFLGSPAAATLLYPGAAVGGSVPIVDLTGTPTFGWQYNGPLTQTSWLLAVKAVGGTWYCWNASTLAWVTTGASGTAPSGTLTWNAGSQQSVTIPLGTPFPPSAPNGFVVGTSYIWSVSTQDSGGTSAFPTTAFEVQCGLTGYTIDTGATTGDRLAHVNGAIRHLSDGTTVFLDYDPNRTAPGLVALQHINWGTDTTPTQVGAISVDSFTMTYTQSLALAVDSNDNIFVIGAAKDHVGAIGVQVFTKVPGIYSWTPGIVQESTGISIPNGGRTPFVLRAGGGGGSSQLFTGALAGFSALWCATGRFGIVFVICDDAIGNKYAVMIDAGALLNQTQIVCNTVVNPPFLGGLNSAAVGSNLDLSASSTGGTQGLAISASSSGHIQVGQWGVDVAGRLAAPGFVDTFTGGTLSATTKCRIVRLNPNSWVAVYPSATSTRLGVRGYSSTALVGYIDPMPTPSNMTSPWPAAGATLSWDATGTPDDTGESKDFYTAQMDESVWVYAWSSVASHLDDLVRISIRSGLGRTVTDATVSGTSLTSSQAAFTSADIGSTLSGGNNIAAGVYITAVSGGVATMSVSGTSGSSLTVVIGAVIVAGTAVIDSLALAGGGASAWMTTIRCARGVIDDTHVDWQANNNNTPGLIGYFSGLAEAPDPPFLLAPQSGSTLGLVGGAVPFAWGFASDTFMDTQSAAYLRVQQLGHGYKWWTGSAWTAEQSAATGGLETPISTGWTAPSVSPATGWGAPGTTYAWSVQVAGRTGLLSGYPQPAAFTIANTSPPTPVLTALATTETVYQQLMTYAQVQQAVAAGITVYWVDPNGDPNVYFPIAPTNVGLYGVYGTRYVQQQVNLTVLTLTLDPTDGTTGFGTSSEASFEYSDDGGSTWTFVRNGQAVAIPLAVPPAATTVTITDQEVTPVYARTYRAQTWSSFWPAGYSAYATVTVNPPTLGQSWLSDPVDGLTLGLNIKPGTLTTNQIEDMTVQYPLGRRLPLVVYSDVHGQDGGATFVVLNFIDEATFQTLMQRQTTLLLRTPEPSHRYIRRTGPVSTASPIPLMSGYREHSVTWVEVDRPS